MKTKLLITLIVLSVGISCYGCGVFPPDGLATQYVEAIASDNCLKASSYWVPEHRREFYDICRKANCKIVETRIDDFEIESSSDPDLPQDKVTLYGVFLHRCDDTGEEYGTEYVNIWFHYRDGEWKIFRDENTLG